LLPINFAYLIGKSKPPSIIDLQVHSIPGV